MSIFFDIFRSEDDSMPITRLRDVRPQPDTGTTEMTDSTDRVTRGRNGGDVGASVETLASRALGVLASKRTSAASLLSERFLDALARAVLGPDDQDYRAVVRDMIAARIRPEDITDFYIPEVARRLGAAWCEDGVSFADVTIGTARLQGLLKEVGGRWADHMRLEPDAPGLLVIVMADEYHTLGAMVLCGQLARMGVSVKLAMGQAESDLLAVVAGGQFDAILISAAQGERLAPLRKLVEKIRAAAVRPVPVVIGGSVVTRVTDIKTQTGADHATTDPREALRACGLKSSVCSARRIAISE
jgi:MerR family transcriptional regulator, light-induced transcriptional regulator